MILMSMMKLVAKNMILNHWFVRLINKVVKMVIAFILSFSFISTKTIPSPYALFVSISAFISKQLRNGVKYYYKTTDTDFDFVSYTKEKTMAINQALEKMVPEESSHFLPACQKLQKAMHYSLMAGGKRIRPMLCIATCEMLGGPKFIAMPAACAVEMIHTMSLIQDDLPCMDNDDLRRGKLTCHKKFGEDFAILASDALISCALLQLGKSVKGVGPERVVRAVFEVANYVGVDGLSGGQAADLGFQSDTRSTNIDSLKKQLEFIHTRKTGGLLQGAVVLGAIFGGGSDGQVEILREFGGYVGLMFQIVDDILDVTKSTEVLGKTAGKDSVAQKLTYPDLIGIEESKELVDHLKKKAHELLACFEKKKATPLIALTDYIANREN